MISRRTVSPPTPESNTPRGRASDIRSGSAGHERRVASAEDLQRDAQDVHADLRLRAGQDERHALVVRLRDETAVGHDAVLGDAAERTLEVGRLDAAGRIRSVDEIADLRGWIADRPERL